MSPRQFIKKFQIPITQCYKSYEQGHTMSLHVMIWVHHRDNSVTTDISYNWFSHHSGSFSCHLKFKLVMQSGQTSPGDEAIWEMACKVEFMPPPRQWQWAFEDRGVKFGHDLYHVDMATLYELALLDIHSQYWETTRPEHLRRYHRGLQYNVERSFRSAGTNATSTYHTPPFLNSWLVRVIFMKLHDKNGRESVASILKDISEDQRLKFERGNFHEDGIVFSFQ